METKKFIIPLFILVVVIMIGGFVFLNNKIVINEQVQQSEEIGRKDELILEGLINDYFYRRKIKDQMFKDFNAYGSVLAKSIVIYVYAKNNEITDFYWPIWKEEIDKGIHETLLDFDDFKWTKDYTFDIVLRKG